MKEKTDSTMTIEQIDREIERLNREVKDVRGRQTEVYTRIVGYYRSVKNWNRGKREEYNHRRTFELPGEYAEKAQLAGTKDEIRRRIDGDQKQSGETLDLNNIASYQYFFRTTCPNCPPVRTYLAELGFPGSEINVDMDEGFELAGELAVCATPTVIFRDSAGNEVLRSANLQELLRAFNKERAAG